MAVEEYGFEPNKFITTATEEIRKKVGSQSCILAISGGVDSTTCGVLMHRALGERLSCIFIDTGFMREGEVEAIRELLTSPPLSLPLKVLEAKQRFLNALAGLSDAEEKRKIFREEFYRALGEEVRRQNATILGQGTIAPDWIETMGGIKTQHNILEQIGIDPKARFGFQIIEPLAELYKDQVRDVAKALKIPAEITQRQPFPGPGLLVRCVEAVNSEKLEITKKACAIFESSVDKSGVQPQQYFAATINSATKSNSAQDPKDFLSENLHSQNVEFEILKSKVTGVKGDIRAYGAIGLVTLPSEMRGSKLDELTQLVEVGGKLVSHFPELTRVLFRIKESGQSAPYIVALRAINTRDFMTAEVTQLPWKTLEEASEKILNSSKDVASVYYDITPKPPATVEFE